MGLIRQAVAGITEGFQRLVHAILGILGVANSYVYILWWTVRFSTARWATESAIVVVLLASGVVVLEIASDIFRKHIELLHFPLWAEILILLVASWLVYHRFKEFQHAREESILATTVAWLFDEIARLHFVPGKEGNYAALQNFVHKVLIAFLSVYGSKRRPQMNVMLQSGDGRLRIHFVEPTTARYEDGISFASGKGAAGMAFSRGVTIYIPSIRFRHGIAIVEGKYELFQMAYEPCAIEEFSSVICAPIQCGGLTFGVLNIDSARQNAFDMTDIHVAQVAASAIGMAIDRYRTGS
jgi:hypothetical protein